ncbi:MAG: DUF58 domain-containing protein [bacterium]
MIPTTDYRKYLQPEVVSRLSRLDLVARLVVEGFITGLHRSPYHGFSVEFSEYRPYMPGDPLRHIDWKVWGRTDRYYVKQFEEETNLRAYLLLDCSGSMAYTSGEVTKLNYAMYLSAALSYLMLLQRDAVGLVTFDKKIRSFFPPRSVFSYLHVLLKEMDGLKCGGETRLSDTFHDLAERIKRRGLIIVLSDLLDKPEDVLTALKHFRHRKHEVIVFHILDPMERNFDFKKDTIFIDMETGEKVQAQPWHIRSEYKEKMRGFLDHYKRECRQHRIDYVPSDTSQPFDTALFNYLVMRKKIGG